MKLFYSFLLFFLLCSSISALPVKVLLQESKRPHWILSSSRGFTFYTDADRKPFPTRQTSQSVTVSFKKDTLYLNKTPLKSEIIFIKPINKSYGSYLGKDYNGYFYIIKQKGIWYLINVIDSEEYLFSVLKSESWPGWPLEINKVMAITTRSYLLHQLLNARKQKLPYHIKNTNYHQCYNGVHECKVIRKAIDETKGLFLAHNNEPILAMFDICCGGVVPCYIDGVVDFKKAPYLARNYACTHCKDCKSYRWQVTYSCDQLTHFLQEGVDDIVHSVKQVKVMQKDKAGLVQQIVAKTEKFEIMFSARQIYKLLKEVKSFVFSVKKKSNYFVLEGKGFGHHLGLCQWGARSMVDKGWDHEEILQFFYPQTNFMRLENTQKM